MVPNRQTFPRRVIGERVERARRQFHHADSPCARGTIKKCERSPAQNPTLNTATASASAAIRGGRLYQGTRIVRYRIGAASILSQLGELLTRC